MPLLHKMTRFMCQKHFSIKSGVILYSSGIEAPYLNRLFSKSTRTFKCNHLLFQDKNAAISPLKRHLPRCNTLSHFNNQHRHSSTTNSPETDGLENNIETLLETWSYEVSSRGSMSAHLPFSTIIKPLPPQDYPDMNKVIIQFHFDQGGYNNIPNSYQLGEISDIYDFKVSFDEDKANMNVSCKLPPRVYLPVICHMQIPLQFELDVNMIDGSHVTVESLESPTIKVQTNTGNCHFKSIKSSSVTVISDSGNISSKSTLLGNASLNTGQDGSITATKLQGSLLHCETESGNIGVNAFYCGEASFKSVSGDVTLGNCHGDVSLESESSDVKIGSLEGDLDVALGSGCVNAHLSKHKKAIVHIEDDGDVCLSFPESVNTSLDLDCNEVTVAENVNAQLSNSELKCDDDNRKINRAIPVSKRLSTGFIGKDGEAETIVKTKGNVHLKQLDWIETTKLAMLMNRENQ